MMTSRPRRISRWNLVPVLAATLSLAAVVVPQRAGPIAAWVTVAPVACSAIVLLLLPYAVLRRDVLLAVAVAGAGLLAVAAYGSSPTARRVTAEDPITILTWNLHAEPVAGVGLAMALERSRPDVVVLQEAAANAAQLMPGDMEASHHPDAASPPGMLLATRLPILRSGTLEGPKAVWDRPRAFWLTLDTGGRPLTVVGVHLSVPFPKASLPCPYCPSLRDAQVAALAAFTADREAMGESVVIAGDFNLTEREVAYGELDGLADTARGNTWRPFPIRWLPPILRLDYVLADPDIGVVSSEVDCAVSSSDHCPLVVQLRRP
jgi:vancomycin resistance protein VanJ